MMRVLKKWIDPIVMRLDDAPLIADLPPKVEYAIGLRMPKFQYDVYKESAEWYLAQTNY
jgi:hypothetical protein